MLVSVAGGPGVIGRGLIPLLVAAGHEVTADSIRSMMTGIRGSSNARARRELGWAPRYASWRSGVASGLLRDNDAERAAAGAPAGGRG